VHRKAVVQTLHVHGRDDSIEHTSAALTHLAKKGRAVSKGNGIWAHPALENADGPTEAGPSVAVSTEGGDRDDPSVAS
jgi:hypothetical protein